MGGGSGDRGRKEETDYSCHGNAVDRKPSASNRRMLRIVAVILLLMTLFKVLISASESSSNNQNTFCK